MTILNGQPIGDPAPKPQVTAAPVTSRPSQVDPTNFVLSLIALISAFVFPLAGAIIGGIAMNQSRRAGQPNTIAKVSFIVGLVLTILIIVIVVVSIVLGVGLFSEIFQICQQLGTGTHDYHGVTYTCS
jgi:uncharacterized Tic20 family protein